MIKKILVANRGEIAMRIFRTCRVMNISTVAVYTHVDRGALHVRYAEEAYCISNSPEDTSYLKPELILAKYEYLKKICICAKISLTYRVFYYKLLFGMCAAEKARIFSEKRKVGKQKSWKI